MTEYTLSEQIVALEGEVSALKLMVKNMVRHGPVTDVDAKLHLARIQLDTDPEDGGEPYKSAWIPYAQHGGDLKVHFPPTKGQNMTVLCPDGEPGPQSFALPYTWSQAFPSPSESADENVLTFGDVKITVKKDRVIFAVKDSTLTLTADAITLKSEKIATDGKTYLGSPDADKEAGMRGTLDTDNDALNAQLATKVYVA